MSHFHNLLSERLLTSRPSRARTQNRLGEEYVPKVYKSRRHIRGDSRQDIPEAYKGEIEARIRAKEEEVGRELKRLGLK